MVILIFSLFFTWQKTDFLPKGAQTIFVGANIQMVQTGFSLPDWMLMMGCAVACNLCLLVNVTPQNRSLLSVVHGIFGVGSLLLIVRHLSPNIGTLIGLGGGLLLAWGAIERFQEGRTLPPNSEKQ